MENFSVRLLARRKELGLSQEQLGKKASASKATVSKWENGASMPSGERLYKVAQVLMVDAAWLLTGKSPTRTATPKHGEIHEVRESDYRRIKKMRMDSSAGVSGAQIEYYDDDKDPLFFRLEWFTYRGIIPEKAAAMRMPGDEMSPFLSNGDTVLVNTDERQPKHDKVYAVIVDSELTVRRLIEERDGWTMAPDNHSFKPRPLTDSVEVVGRVRWISRDNL